MSITLYEMRGADDRRFSVFSWRARMALAHKGLPFRTEALLLGDKAALAFSGGTTVPVIRDGETAVRDSWAIATYLERTYPERPSLFGGPAGEALSHVLNGWADRTVIPLVAPLIAADIHERLDPADRAAFRAGFERVLGGTLEELRDRRDTAAPTARRALDPVRVSLKVRPFLAGDAPAYADYIVFSVLQWARITSPFALLAADDPLRAWFERLLDLHDGLGRAEPAASEVRAAA